MRRRSHGLKSRKVELGVRKGLKRDFSSMQSPQSLKLTREGDTIESSTFDSKFKIAFQTLRLSFRETAIGLRSWGHRGTSDGLVLKHVDLAQEQLRCRAAEFCHLYRAFSTQGGKTRFHR
jgi:hypothetical protein